MSTDNLLLVKVEPKQWYLMSCIAYIMLSRCCFVPGTVIWLTISSCW